MIGGTCLDDCIDDPCFECESEREAATACPDCSNRGYVLDGDDALVCCESRLVDEEARVYAALLGAEQDDAPRIERELRLVQLVRRHESAGEREISITRHLPDLRDELSELTRAESQAIAANARAVQLMAEARKGRVA